MPGLSSAAGVDKRACLGVTRIRAGALVHCSCVVLIGVTRIDNDTILVWPCSTLNIIH